jgi:hypothetical protein
MSNQSKHEHEGRHAKRFLEGLMAYAALERPAAPRLGREGHDFWVRRHGAPTIALELTEYHPDEHGVRRIEIESRWHRGLEPELERLRRARPNLQHVGVRVGFRDRRLPQRRDQSALARELVELVERVAPALANYAADIDVVFLPREMIDRVPAAVQGCVFVPQEDWPRCCQHLSGISVRRRDIIVWPPWNCPQVMAAFVGFTGDELAEILRVKAAKAHGYELGDAPLWLLVVTDLGDDVRSHAFPTNDNDLRNLAAAIRASGFDFGASPFEEVWLYSEFTGARLCLYPAARLGCHGNRHTGMGGSGS